MSSNLAVYKETAQVSELGQDEVVTQHASLVKRIAYHLMSRLPSCVQVEDLIQAGMISRSWPNNSVLKYIGIHVKYGCLIFIIPAIIVSIVTKEYPYIRVFAPNKRLIGISNLSLVCIAFTKISNGPDPHSIGIFNIRRCLEVLSAVWRRQQYTVSANGVVVLCSRA